MMHREFGSFTQKPLTNFSPYNDWPTSFPSYAEGILLRGIEGENLFQTNLMLPPVSQIIFINPRFLPAEVEVPQPDLVRIVVEAHSSGSADPVRFPANEELVQMLIRPAERNLQRVMQLGNGAVAAHEQTTPNLGTDVAYPDTQLIHLHDLICAAHALPLLQSSLSRVYRHRLRKESQMGPS
jgi:hypothetical protein